MLFKVAKANKELEGLKYTNLLIKDQTKISINKSNGLRSSGGSTLEKYM